ncbi:hypothetical protein CaCOL14_012322 [Colletotrichum acutatum]
MNTPHPSVLRSLDTSGFGHLQDNIVSDEAETSPERTPRQVLSRHRCAQSIVSVAASGAEGGDAIAWVSTCFVVLPQKRQTHGVAGETLALVPADRRKLVAEVDLCWEILDWKEN